jgi:hypothetical protein
LPYTPAADACIKIGFFPYNLLKAEDNNLIDFILLYNILFFVLSSHRLVPGFYPERFITAVLFYKIYANLYIY